MYYHEITWEQLEHRLCEAFGRELTTDEDRWFHAVWTLANS